MPEGARNYYLVRAMEQTEEEFAVFFDNNVVAVGWSSVDFTSFDDMDALIDSIDKSYHTGYDVAPQVAGRKRNEVRRFKGIKKGDRILIPYPEAVCLATAKPKEVFSKASGDEYDLANQRLVNYERDKDGKIVFRPRTELTHGLQTRIRTRGATCRGLDEFSEEIERLFSKTDVTQRLLQSESELEKCFRSTLLTNMQTGNTYLSAGGKGLEYLVQELLEIEGYDAKILSTHRFRGLADADIEAVRPDRFQEVRLLVQVKHHRGITGLWGVDQLKSIFLEHKDEFTEYHLVLVTSGKSDKELREYCNSVEVDLIDGVALTAWISELRSSLKSITKCKLGISEVPNFLF